MTSSETRALKHAALLVLALGLLRTAAEGVRSPVTTQGAASADSAGLVVLLVGRSLMLGQISGVDEMIGLVGQSSSSIDPEGKVFIRGEYWNVQADEPIDEGQPVEVVAVEGLMLRVRRAAGSR